MATVALTISLLCISIASAPLRSQTTGQKLAFDVASIKLNTQTNTGTGIRVTTGRLHVENYTVKLLMQRAYDVQSFQIKGPEWIGTEHYDIEAASPGKESAEQVAGVMLQALLEDRFALKFHREHTEGTILALNLDKNGPKLRKSGCAPIDPPNSRPRPGEPAPYVCGSVKEGGGRANWTLDAIGMTVSELAKNLSLRLDRPVVDQTGLRDVFDIHLEYSPNTESANDDSGTLRSSVFTALREQLGLRLVSTKGPVEVLVIDSVQKPTVN